MKFISTKIHGVLDYLVALLLVLVPWLFGFYNNALATYIPVMLGAATLAYSLCTDYEFGVIRVLSLRTHLIIDLLSGILLATSPWIFGFNTAVYKPHLIIGILEIFVVIATQNKVRSVNNK